MDGGPEHRRRPRPDRAVAALVLALAVLAPYVYVSALQPSSRATIPLSARLRQATT
jgi:hypothetical protein